MAVRHAVGGGLVGAATAAALTAFLGRWEGSDPVARHQAIDPPGVITFCTGLTNYDDPTVKVGERFSKAECDRLLQGAIPRYLAPLQKCVKNFDAMPVDRQVALGSFSYNVGPAAACKSSVIRKINAGDVKGGCDALMLYDRANGKVLKGLQNRRADERKLCRKGL